jgi:hypothetical protein
VKRGKYLSAATETARNSPLQRATTLEATMPQTPHIERHFTGSATVRDIVTGASPVRSSVQTVSIGGVAATAAFLIARAIS